MPSIRLILSCLLLAVFGIAATAQTLLIDRPAPDWRARQLPKGSLAIHAGWSYHSLGIAGIHRYHQNSLPDLRLRYGLTKRLEMWLSTTAAHQIHIKSPGERSRRMGWRDLHGGMKLALLPPDRPARLALSGGLGFPVGKDHFTYGEYSLRLGMAAAHPVYRGLRFRYHLGWILPSTGGQFSGIGGYSFRVEYTIWPQKIRIFAGHHADLPIFRDLLPYLDWGINYRVHRRLRLEAGMDFGLGLDYRSCRLGVVFRTKERTRKQTPKEK